MAAEDEVRAASKRFYAALTRMLNGDASALTGIWSHAPTVTTMHPIGGRQVGWDQVRGSFERVAQVSSRGHVELIDQFIQVAGETAYELGIEQGQFWLYGQLATVDARATNIYRREAGAWKIVHHHGDLSPNIIDVLSRLNT